MKAALVFCLHISTLLNSSLFCLFFMEGEGRDGSRMGCVGNVKIQKDEVWKQVEGKIYLDYLKVNMRNKWRTWA